MAGILRIGIFLLGVVMLAGKPPRPLPQDEEAFKGRILPLLDRYCFRCHNTNSFNGVTTKLIPELL